MGILRPALFNIPEKKMKFFAFTFTFTVLARVSPVYGQGVQDEAFCAKACSCPCNQNSGGFNFHETILKYLDCNMPTMLSMFGVMDKKQANQAVELCKIVSHEAKIIQQDIETKDSFTTENYEIYVRLFTPHVVRDNR